MDFSKQILKEYTDNADKRLAFICGLLIGFMVLVVVLNLTGVFKIAPMPLYLAAGISIFDFFLPTLFCDILKLRSVRIRYVILTVIVLQSGIQYAALSYHTIMMLVFPVVIACLYNEKKYVIYTMIISLPTLLVSHLAAFWLKIVPDEPLITLRGTVFYGILPRTIEFFAISLVCIFISDRIERLIQTLASKNRELYEDQENLILSLSQIIENKSEYTGQHVRRVAEYTELLCHSLGYSDEDSWKISLASMLHDVGKVMIPEEILEKPGKLTPEEFDIMKNHIQYGRKMLEKTPGELFRI